ncbi:MAG: TolC family protein [Balneolaceae bacterium]
MMRILLFVFLVMLVPRWVEAQDELTLNEAIELALENHFQILQAENDLGMAEAQIRSAQANFLPGLSASLGGNQNVGRQFVQEDATFADRTTYGISGSIRTDITIFRGFENINQLRQSRVNRDMQEADNQRLREQIVFNTAMQYLQVLLDEELVGIAEQNLEISRQQLEQVSAQVEVGSRPIVDQYQQESVVASNELSLVQAENALQVSRTQLYRILQIDPLEQVAFVAPDIDEEELVPSDLDLNQMIQFALQNRSDVQAQKLNLQTMRYDLELARAAYYPSVTANANFNTRYSDQYRLANETVGFQDQFFEQMITRSVGFSVTIPIFNRLNTRTSVEQAQVQLKNARLNLDDLEYGVREEIGQAYSDYVALSKELSATEKALVAAERTYLTQQQRYEIGSTTLIELNQATTDYMESQSNRLRTTYNFVFQEKLLDYYLGRLSEQLSPDV